MVKYIPSIWHTFPNANDQFRFLTPNRFCLEMSLKHLSELIRKYDDSDVAAAVGFGFRGRYLKEILFEREAWMPNWLFNREVIGNRRAAMDGFIASHRSSGM